MKHLHVIAIAILLNGFYIASAQAGSRAMNGLIIGAGSGALIGQAAGRNTESVVVGTAVGSVIGYVIGSELERDRRGTVYSDRYRPVVRHYAPAPRPYTTYRYLPSHNLRDRDCRKYIKIVQHHNTRTRIVKTTCYNDRDYAYNWRH